MTLNILLNGVVKMRVLVTGFEPYGKENYNPSKEIAVKLDGKEINGSKIFGAEMPVSYRRIRDALITKIEEIKPQIVINLGLAPGVSYIRVERVAINIMDAGPDNDGYRPVDEPIEPSGPPAYFATIPIKKIVKELKENGIPAAISNSAGTFLCNCIMYHTLHYISTKKLKAIAGFIHIPYIPRQAAEKERYPPPSLPLTLIERAVRIAIKTSLDSWNEKFRK